MYVVSLMSRRTVEGRTGAGAEPTAALMGGPRGDAARAGGGQHLVRSRRKDSGRCGRRSMYATRSDWKGNNVVTKEGGDVVIG